MTLTWATKANQQQSRFCYEKNMSTVTLTLKKRDIMEQILLLKKKKNIVKILAQPSATVWTMTL